MISVLNHLRRLSGSRLIIAFLVVVGCAGCSTLRPAQQKSGTSDRPRETQHPQVYNPTTGKYEPVEDPKKMVDTIRLTEEDPVFPPVTAPDSKTRRKDVYDVAFMMPFDAARNTSITPSTDARVRRFVHYYAGVKLALEELTAQGIRIRAKVYDTREDNAVSKSILQSINDVDAIVGPYEIESLRDAAILATKKRIPVFSPWTPSISVDENSPYFIQLIPGLEAHAEAIMEFVAERYAGARVFLVARDDAREKSRLTFFRDFAARYGIQGNCSDFIINDETADLSKTSFVHLTSRTQPTVFILPLFSRNDEDFINAFLRKLHAEKGTHVVSVFGMPQWMSFHRLNADYLESTNTHISTTHFVDPADFRVKEFQRRFFEVYGTVPEPAAHQGYTLVHFLGNALYTYGTAFLNDISDKVVQLPDQEYHLVSYFRNPVPERQNVANYIENRAIRILRFIDHAFRKA